MGSFESGTVIDSGDSEDEAGSSQREIRYKKEMLEQMPPLDSQCGAVDSLKVELSRNAKGEYVRVLVLVRCWSFVLGLVLNLRDGRVRSRNRYLPSDRISFRDRVKPWYDRYTFAWLMFVSSSAANVR